VQILGAKIWSFFQKYMDKNSCIGNKNQYIEILQGLKSKKKKKH